MLQNNADVETPPGVNLVDYNDYPTIRGNILKRVRKAMSKSFPQSYGGVRMELNNVRYDNEDSFSLSDQKDALLKDKYLTKKLKGTVRIIDEATEQPIEEKDLSLMRVPWLTDRGSFIHGGNEYTTIMQSRLMPGVYTRRQANGHLETQFNVKPGTGIGFRIGFEPDTAQYRIKISQANLHMYSLLRELGVPDEELEKKWGPDIFKANRDKYDSRVLDKAFERLVPKKLRKADLPLEQKVGLIKDAFNKASIAHYVANRNLPGMLGAKQASEERAKWAGREAMQKVAAEKIEAMPFSPDFKPDEVYADMLDDDFEKSAAAVGVQPSGRTRWPAPRKAWRSGASYPNAGATPAPMMRKSFDDGINPRGYPGYDDIMKQNNQAAVDAQMQKEHPVLNYLYGKKPQPASPAAPAAPAPTVATPSPTPTATAPAPVVAANVKSGSDVDAYVIKGNPEVMGKDIDKYNAFYESVADVLKQKGLSVGFDDGLAHTLPPGGKYWVGHSRGAGRLKYAPEGVKTLTLDDFEPEETRLANAEAAAKVMKELGVSSFADVPVAKRRAPGPEHYTLNDNAIKALQDLVADHQAPEEKEAALGSLLQAKGHSDKKQYGAKHRIMALMMYKTPDEFLVDSDDGQFLGITHAPTGFRMHLPKNIVPAVVRANTPDSKTASIHDEFKPDLTGDDLRDEYNALYGRVGPRLAGMKSWDKSWIPESSGLGWLDWYKQYDGGKRTDDDDKQIRRWKSFKARQSALFKKNPTPRMAFSLKNWAIDPLKLVDEEDRAQLEKDMKEYKDQAEKEYREKKASFSDDDVLAIAQWLNNHHGAGLPLDVPTPQLEEAIMQFVSNGIGEGVNPAVLQAGVDGQEQAEKEVAQLSKVASVIDSIRNGRFDELTKLANAKELQVREVVFPGDTTPTHFVTMMSE